MEKRWECLESSKIFEATDGRATYMELYQDRVRTPKGNVVTYTRYYASDVVIVVPFLDDEKLVMIRQYRYPLGKVILEFPAGHVESGEDPAETARRELEEETGYRAGKMEYVYTYHPAVSRTKQNVHVYRATGLSDSGRTSHDGGEDIVIETMTVGELRKTIAERKVESAGTLVAYLLCCSTEIKTGGRV